MYSVYLTGVTAQRSYLLHLAGAPGFEPGYLVLETRVLPLDDTPIDFNSKQFMPKQQD